MFIQSQRSISFSSSKRVLITYLVKQAEQAGVISRPLLALNLSTVAHIKHWEKRGSASPEAVGIPLVAMVPAASKNFEADG